MSTHLTLSSAAAAMPAPWAPSPRALQLPPAELPFLKHPPHPLYSRRTSPIHCPARSPVDAWLELEDLCWRLRQAGVLLEFEGGQLRLRDFALPYLPQDLRAAVLDTDTYAWWVPDEMAYYDLDGSLCRGAVVATLHREGSDLVLSLPAASVVQRFPDCAELIQLQAALAIAVARLGPQVQGTEEVQMTHPGHHAHLAHPSHRRLS